MERSHVTTLSGTDLDSVSGGSSTRTDTGKPYQVDCNNPKTYGERLFDCKIKKGYKGAPDTKEGKDAQNAQHTWDQVHNFFGILSTVTTKWAPPQK